ncbi:helix-turn-helix domain-containing protein [Streptomyces sp. NPDC046805]|uniref:helix-turn-helix domain-containing protein n=1 Tax=Streptomyces sp. NPDC046805 TaxID=3155134 RepID=UPI0033EB7FCA
MAPTDLCTEAELGPVRVSVLRFADAVWHRVPCDEPCAWHLALASDGPLVVGSCRRDVTRVEPGCLVLWEPSGLFAARSAEVPPLRPTRMTVLSVPPRTLPVPYEVLRALVVRPLAATTGPGALLARFLDGLAGQASDVDAVQAAWLGWAAVNLTVAFFAGTEAPPDEGLAPSRQGALVHEVKGYIDRRLGDPELSPKTIADAHHISVRYLHHLFQQDGLTVGGFVRERRLGHCRADLASPRVAELSVGQVGARWGFTDAAVFGRTFKKAYGVAPGEYRRRCALAQHAS